MSYSIKGILKKIEQKKDLEKNLSDYTSLLMTKYNQYAVVGFSMKYFVLYQVMQEEATEEEKVILKQLNDIVKKGIVSDFDGLEREKCISKLNALRDEILKRVDTLVDFSERLIIYDYVISRVEHGDDREPVFNIDDNEDNVKQIMSMIVDGGKKDEAIISEKIREILSQLPVRMTKGKFLDLLDNSLSLFKGAEKSSLDSYLYKIRSSATLYKSKGDGSYYVDLAKRIDNIKDADYANMTPELWNELSKELVSCKESIEEYIENYYMIQEAINALFVLILTKPYVLDEETFEGTRDICDKIINKVCETFESNYEKDLSEKDEKEFELLEGIQEECFLQYSALESELYMIKDEHEELIEALMLANQFDCLSKCEKLSSTSLFVELEEDKEADKEVSEDDIKKISAELQEEFSELFKNSSKYIKRSIMANVMSKMPIFFNSLQETEEYILNALENCREKYEKKISIELICDILGSYAMGDDYIDGME